jgi:hypothetical protein
MQRHLNAGLLKSGLRGIAATVAMAAVSFGAAPVQAAPSPSTYAPCFFITQWNGWKSPDPKVVYLGVNMHDVYRLDLAAPSSQLGWPDVHLISEVRGSSSICSAIDLQLSVGDTNGFREPLFPAKLTKMTPEEVAAIPKKFRPN